PVGGFEVVGLLKVNGVDLLELHELLDVDGTGALNSQVGQLFVGDDDVAVLVVFVAPDNFVLGHLPLAVGAKLQVTDAAAADGVELVEGDVFALGRRVDLDGDVDQAKAEGALPECLHAAGSSFLMSVGCHRRRGRTPSRGCAVGRATMMDAASRPVYERLVFPWLGPKTDDGQR